MIHDGVARQRSGWKILISCMLLAIVYAGLTVPFLLDWPPPWPDESHFAEPASVLSRTGSLHSELIPAFSREILWQPPGYFYFLAAVIPVVGFDFAHLRAVSIVTGGVLCLAVGFLGMQTGRRWIIAVLAAGLLIINPNFTTYIKLIRMDGLSMVLQVAGMLVLIASDRFRRRGTLLLAAGTVFAAGILVHPLGAIGLCAGAIFVLRVPSLTRSERFRSLGLVVIPAASALVLWFVLVVHDHGAFAEQMRLQFGRKSRPPWESVMNCMQRYRSIPAFALLVLATGAAWVRGTLWRRSAAHAAVGSAAVLSMVVVALAFELQYHIFMLPWISLCVALGMKDAFDNAGRRGRMLLGTLGAVVVLNLGAYPVVLYNTLHTLDPVPESAAQVYERAARALPARATVLMSGYPDGYWLLRESRPDLRLLGGVVFSDADRRTLREEATHVAIARAFDPESDSVSLFSEVRGALGVSASERWGTIVAREGVMKRLHPSVWIVELDRGQGTGGK